MNVEQDDAGDMGDIGDAGDIGNINDSDVHNLDDVPEQIDKTDKNTSMLKVKADDPDISSEERKKRVKKLAGAISHSLRANGEVNVRCFGNASIGKASKSIAIAQTYIGIGDNKGYNKLRLQCSPAFITTKMGDNELTGISFYTFASEKDPETDFTPEKCKSTLLVKADPKDTVPEIRKKNVKNLAGAIAHALEENKEVLIRCFGNATIGKASKALAIARGLVATRGPDLYAYPMFIVATIEGKERTGIVWYAFTNEM